MKKIIVIILYVLITLVTYANKKDTLRYQTVIIGTEVETEIRSDSKDSYLKYIFYIVSAGLIPLLLYIDRNRVKEIKSKLAEKKNLNEYNIELNNMKSDIQNIGNDIEQFVTKENFHIWTDSIYEKIESMNPRYHFEIGENLIKNEEYMEFVAEFQSKYKQDLGSFRSALITLGKCYYHLKEPQKLEEIIGFMRLTDTNQESVVIQKLLEFHNELNQNSSK